MIELEDSFYGNSRRSMPNWHITRNKVAVGDDTLESTENIPVGKLAHHGARAGEKKAGIPAFVFPNLFSFSGKNGPPLKVVNFNFQHRDAVHLGDHRSVEFGDIGMSSKLVIGKMGYGSQERPELWPQRIRESPGKRYILTLRHCGHIAQRHVAVKYAQDCGNDDHRDQDAGKAGGRKVPKQFESRRALYRFASS